jgi:hypothetical protein
MWYWKDSNKSLALQHQPHHPTDKIDIFKFAREVIDPIAPLPPTNQRTAPEDTYTPLVHLATNPDKVPVGVISKALVHYCTDHGSTNPITAAQTIAMTDLNFVTSYIERIRTKKLAHLVHLLGSPTHHLTREKACPEVMYPCEACGHPTPTLWETTYKY